MAKHTIEMANEAISIAKSHEGAPVEMRTSAIIAREDAESCLSRGLYEYAIRRSRDSISYSLGIFSAPYQTLTAMI